MLLAYAKLGKIYLKSYSDVYEGEVWLNFTNYIGQYPEKLIYEDYPNDTIAVYSNSLEHFDDLEWELDIIYKNYELWIN